MVFDAAAAFRLWRCVIQCYYRCLCSDSLCTPWKNLLCSYILKSEYAINIIYSGILEAREVYAKLYKTLSSEWLINLY